MSATLFRTVVDDLMKDFRQQFDDKMLQKSQVAHWVIMIGNRLLSQHIAKRDSGAYLSIYPDVPIQVASENSAPNIVKGRKYIVLPTCIFDYNQDGGVEYVSYYNRKQKPGCPPPFTNVLFNRTTPSDLMRKYGSTYEKPSPQEPCWYRAGQNIYLVGIECINPDAIEIGIYSTIKPVTDPDLDLDKPFPFPEELLIQLKRQVLDLGRFVMVIPEERVNDGVDGQKQVPGGKITSVNELTEDFPENR